MTLRSALYIGSVMHRRLRPRPHHFRYSAFWMLIDLDEVERLSEEIIGFSYNRAGLFSVYNADYGDGSDVPLRTQIERKLDASGIDITGGCVDLLCIPRMFGYSFSPLNIFFCYRAGGGLAAVIHEVHNTFGERHSYVMPVAGGGSLLHQRCRKLFHVSPFLDMDMRYDFRIAGPDERIRVGIAASTPDGPMLTAVMTGTRESFSTRNLVHVALTLPFFTLRVIAAIHWEALRLWLKRTPLYRHPGTRPSAEPAAAVTETI